MTWRVEFSEPVDLDLSDLRLTSALVSDFTPYLELESVSGIKPGFTTAITPDSIYDLRLDASTLSSDLGLDSFDVSLILDVSSITDLSGNVAVLPAWDFPSTTFEVDYAPPRIVSVRRHTPSVFSTGSDELIWEVTFSEPVDNVSGNHFEILGSPSLLTRADAILSHTSPDRTVYRLSTNSSSIWGYNGVLSLGLSDSVSITDDHGTLLSSSLPTGSFYESYRLTNDGFGLTVISLLSDNPHSGNYVNPSHTLSLRITAWADEGDEEFAFDNFELTGVVPEPSTYALIFGGIALGVVILRRKLKQSED